MTPQELFLAPLRVKGQGEEGGKIDKYVGYSRDPKPLGWENGKLPSLPLPLSCQFLNIINSLVCTKEFVTRYK